MAEEDGSFQEEPDDLGLKSLEAKFEREGLDTRLLSEPFLEAAELGDAASLRQKLNSLSPDERRKFVKSVDQHGCTGLVLVGRRGDAEVAAVLLDAGANPNDADGCGVTALHYAANRGACDTILELLKACAEVIKRDDSGDTPLMWARGAQTIQVLLEARADAHARNAEGKTALMCASAHGDLDSVAALVTVPGTELDAHDHRGISAHEAAVVAGHEAVGELLVSLGARAAAAPAARMVLQDEALHEAARRGDAEACIVLLRQGTGGRSGTGVDVDVEVAGETALLLAIGAGSGRTVEVLLAARADPNRADAFMQETPLMRAVLAGCSNELLWLLLEVRADPSREDLIGRTPASAAAAWGQIASCVILEAAAAGKLGLSGMD